MPAATATRPSARNSSSTCISSAIMIPTLSLLPLSVPSVGKHSPAGTQWQDMQITVLVQMA